MQQQSVDYFDSQERLVAQLLYDETVKGQQPAVIVFPAFEGCGEFVIDYGRRLVKAGFVAFVADMYGNGKVADTLASCFQLVSPFVQDRRLTRRRACLALDTVAKLTSVDTHRIGSVGFCFGGMCVLEVARSGAALKVGIGAHAMLAKSDLPTERIQAHLMLLQGYQDPMVPAVDSLREFAEEMESAQAKDWVFTLFSDAKHSFTDPRTGTYDPDKEADMGRAYHPVAAARTFRYAVDFLKEIL